jgi:hypothetical protein
VDRRIFFGFVLILAGGIVLSLPHGQKIAISPGVILIAAACLCWGIDNNLTRRISGSVPSQIAMWKGLAAGMVSTGIALALGGKLPAASIVFGTAVIGFFGYGLSLVLFCPGLAGSRPPPDRRLFFHRTVCRSGVGVCYRTGTIRLEILRCGDSHAPRCLAPCDRTPRAFACS